ncbi:serine/arginine repetitive matrix protein 2 isoform X1 [Mugil cephalus]|uniref:serine/arginine repetitive matrix protein 2 isoform X1 n=1 Tax=Mugil cephalus TaxID=48193 RepID=UPI001FB7D146|nr:serine/arginine repetitive matrix protein 2 isoform X1 [Mugil cephalus]
MIDLSHLTEEEQGVIMTVLRRDAELKKAEEERIRKLEKILNTESRPDFKLKYLTGEWFYEAKSRRHTDKIHGSEIILASMKQGKGASLDGSLRIDKSRTTTSSLGPDIVPPAKPARCLEALQAQETNDVEKENRNSGIRSPRTPRHNPFNRASLIVVEPPDHNRDSSSSREPESLETEPISPLKSHPPGDAGQISGGSLTSEGSSVGFRPVPKKRTFLSRRTSTQSELSGSGVDDKVGPAGVVPAPRRNLQRGSSGSSSQSLLKNPDETAQKNAVTVSNQVSQSAQASRSANETSTQLPRDLSQVSSNSSLEKERLPPSMTRERPGTYTKSDKRETPQRVEERNDDQNQRDHAGLNFVTPSASSIQDKENSSSVGTETRQEELSLPQSIVDPDPPISYDLKLIDKSDQQGQKSNQTHAFKLSTQTASPTGEEEDSIAKVLDWFSRSTDSSEWLNAEDDAEQSNEKREEVGKLRGEDSPAKDGGGVVSGRKKDTCEKKRSHIELRLADRTDSKEIIESQKEVKTDSRERIHSQDNVDESQPPKISHLKSFWEKSNTGPKILISKSVSPGDKGQKPVQVSAEPEVSSAPVIYSGKGIQDRHSSNQSDEREQLLVISPHADMGNAVHIESLVISSTPKNNNNSTHNTDYLKLTPREAERRGSDAEVLSTTRLSPSRTAFGLEAQSVSLVKPQPDNIFDSREPIQQEELVLTVPEPFTDYKHGGSDLQLTPKAAFSRGSSEDVKRRNSEDKGVHSHKRIDDTASKDRINSPRLNRQGLPHQESTAEKIKQLKSFWEQERNKPMFYPGKPKPLGDGKVGRGATQAKLNKRFTKSEYDLRSVGNESGSDGEDKNHPNFTILPLNQRLDKVAPSLGTSRTQFNTLREFWDEATSDYKGSFSLDKPKSPKSPKRKEASSSQELKVGEPEIYRLSVEKTRPPVIKSSPPPQNRSKSPHDRQTGSGSRAGSDSKNSLSNYLSVESGQQRMSRRSSKDASREEKSTKPQSPGKEIRSPKHRRDSFSTSSSRGGSLRRATSMFSLSAPDDKEPIQLKMDVSPVHSQSRKQRHSIDKGSLSRRASEDTETLAPRARAFVPRDYRHYLGMTDKTSVHTSLAPTVKTEEPEGKSGYELDVSGPVRASTPVSSEDRHIRRTSKMSQRPLWPNYSSSDTGQESSVSSTSETWSNTRNSSNRENDDDDQNPVRKALRRAEVRPKNLAKSMEDITASLPRQERRQDPTVELRRISDVSSISPSSSLFSDPDHLKKMSKSVPSFLQKEDADTDSTSEDTYPVGRRKMGSSVSNITSSSGMASVSSVCSHPTACNASA